jgi:hypothetical protein
MLLVKNTNNGCEGEDQHGRNQLQRESLGMQKHQQLRNTTIDNLQDNQGKKLI